MFGKFDRGFSLSCACVHIKIGVYLKCTYITTTSFTVDTMKVTRFNFSNFYPGIAALVTEVGLKPMPPVKLTKRRTM